MRFWAHQTSNGWGSIVRKHKSKEGTQGLSWLSKGQVMKEPKDQNLGKDERKKLPTPPECRNRVA